MCNVGATWTLQQGFQGKVNAKTQAWHEEEGEEGGATEKGGEQGTNKGQCSQKKVNEKENGKI